MIPFVAVSWDIFASLMGPSPNLTPENSVTQLANATVVISVHRPQAEHVYFLPAPPPAAFFSSAAFCLASMMAATFSFSLWLPRAMLYVASCHTTNKDGQ